MVMSHVLLFLIRLGPEVYEVNHVFMEGEGCTRLPEPAEDLSLLLGFSQKI